MLLLLAADLSMMAVMVHSLTALIVGTIVGGLFLGVMNTVLTESVMHATDLPRSVASSTYSGIRFVGGAVAPALAGVIAERLSSAAPYWVGAGALIVSILVLAVGRRNLGALEPEPAGRSLAEARLLTAADA